MANNMTTYLADKLLAHVLKAGAGAAYTQPATVYIGLFTADPTKAGTQTNEVSGGSYARVAVTFGALSTNGVYEECKNALVTFATATANWGTVTHLGIMDASTAGNMLFYGPLTVQKVVSNGDTFSLPANNVVVDLG